MTEWIKYIEDSYYNAMARHLNVCAVRSSLLYL